MVFASLVFLPVCESVTHLGREKMPAQARVTRVRPVMRAPTYVTRYIPTANWGEGVVVLVQLIKVMHNSKRNATVTNPKGWVEKLSRGCSDCHEGAQ